MRLSAMILLLAALASVDATNAGAAVVLADSELDAIHAAGFIDIDIKRAEPLAPGFELASGMGGPGRPYSPDGLARHRPAASVQKNLAVIFSEHGDIRNARIENANFVHFERAAGHGGPGLQSNIGALVAPNGKVTGSEIMNLNAASFNGAPAGAALNQANVSIIVSNGPSGALVSSANRIETVAGHGYAGAFTFSYRGIFASVSVHASGK